MTSAPIEPDWTVEWVASTPSGDGYLDNLVLSREQAVEYGDRLVQSLRVDGEMLRDRGLDPEEPFAWKVKDGGLLTKQISRQSFEEVAASDRDDSEYARRVLRNRAERRLRQSK